MTAADAIAGVFEERYRYWGLRLPVPDVAGRRAGHLFERGWHVGYRWGAEDGEEYVEILAQHRMSGDDRFRIFASGRIESLPAPGSTWSYGPGATQQEIDAARERSVERNRRLYAELRELGLLPPQGRNLPAHEIAEFLATGRDRDEDAG